MLKLWLIVVIVMLKVWLNNGYMIKYGLNDGERMVNWWSTNGWWWLNDGEIMISSWLNDGEIMGDDAESWAMMVVGHG